MRGSDTEQNLRKKKAIFDEPSYRTRKKQTAQINP